MARKTSTRSASRKNLSADTDLGANQKQEELSTDGASWRQKYTANVYGSRSELLPRKRTAPGAQKGTSAPPPSDDSEKQD